jgi:hypothetical protein
MKLAWLVWEYEDSNVEFRSEEPRYCYKKLQIVYAVIDESIGTPYAY